MQPVDSARSGPIGDGAGRTIRFVYVVTVAVALLVGLAAGLVAARTRGGGWWPWSGATRANGAPADGDRGAPAVPAALTTGTGPALLARQVLEALAEGVIVVDRGDNVLLANPSAHTLGAMVGDRLATDALRQITHDALDSATIERVTVELRHGPLGREFTSVAVAAVPLGHDEIGRVSAVALLLTDMTETRRLEAVRRDFVANVSHELKTPVGALTLLAEAIQSAADDPQAVERFAGRIQHEGQRLGRLVGELIALSRVQGADALPVVQPVPVERMFAEAIDRTRLAADRVGISLTASVPGGLAVLGDEVQLTTAVANLADNAVAYSGEGTRVVLSARALPDDSDGAKLAELAVTDQGIGIAEADQDRIFERFYRVDPARSRATGGTGLGLAIVKHIVTNHGGSVHVWSSEGSGSTFSIRLPRALDVASTKGNR